MKRGPFHKFRYCFQVRMPRFQRRCSAFGPMPETWIKVCSSKSPLQFQPQTNAESRILQTLEHVECLLWGDPIMDNSV